MSDKRMIDADELIRAVYETWGNKNVGDAFGLVEIGKILDSLAVPVEDGAIESALLSFSGHAQKSMDTEVWRKLLHKARIELAALRRPVDRQALYQLIKKCGHTSHRSSSHNKGQEWIDTPIDIMLDAIMELTGKKE
jgi:hypothetical protein